MNEIPLYCMLIKAHNQNNEKRISYLNDSLRPLWNNEMDIYNDYVS